MGLIDMAGQEEGEEADLQGSGAGVVDTTDPGMSMVILYHLRTPLVRCRLLA